MSILGYDMAVLGSKLRAITLANKRIRSLVARMHVNVLGEVACLVEPPYGAVIVEIAW
jgi:hypothetical protein